MDFKWYITMTPCRKSVNLGWHIKSFSRSEVYGIHSGQRLPNQSNQFVHFVLSLIFSWFCIICNLCFKPINTNSVYTVLQSTVLWTIFNFTSVHSFAVVSNRRLLVILQGTFLVLHIFMIGCKNSDCPNEITKFRSHILWYIAKMPPTYIIN